MPLPRNRANRVHTDDKGYAVGKIVEIVDVSAEESQFEKDALKWTIEAPGLVKPCIFTLWTGQHVSPEKNDFSVSKTGDFNKLTRLCLKFGLVKERQLNNLSDDEYNAVFDALEALEGREVKFKITYAKREGKGLSGSGVYSQIDLETLELLPEVKAESNGSTSKGKSKSEAAVPAE